MNALKTKLFNLHESGAKILKGRTKKENYRVMYQYEGTVFCQENGKIIPPKDFYKPFPTEKQTSAKLLMILLQRAEKVQSDLIKMSNTPDELKSINKVATNLSIAKICAEELNLNVRN